jgi:Leucine-rich repeat (LRR) protein
MHVPCPTWFGSDEVSNVIYSPFHNLSLPLSASLPSTPLHSPQGIQSIQGLEGCPRLRQLWLLENRITSLAGLAPLKGGHLVELYLTSNRLTSLEGLSGLTGLKVCVYVLCLHVDRGWRGQQRGQGWCCF